MCAKLPELVALAAIGIAMPLVRSPAAVPAVPWPPQPVPGVAVTVVYPTVAVDTSWYRFVGDDHRQIVIRAMETFSYRFVYDHHHIQIVAYNP